MRSADENVLIFSCVYNLFFKGRMEYPSRNFGIIFGWCENNPEVSGWVFHLSLFCFILVNWNCTRVFVTHFNGPNNNRHPNFNHQLNYI